MVFEMIGSSTNKMCLKQTNTFYVYKSTKNVQQRNYQSTMCPKSASKSFGANGGLRQECCISLTVLK